MPDSIMASRRSSRSPSPTGPTGARDTTIEKPLDSSLFPSLNLSESMLNHSAPASADLAEPVGQKMATIDKAPEDPELNMEGTIDRRQTRLMAPNGFSRLDEFTDVHPESRGRYSPDLPVNVYPYFDIGLLDKDNIKGEPAGFRRYLIDPMSSDSVYCMIRNLDLRELTDATTLPLDTSWSETTLHPSTPFPEDKQPSIRVAAHVLRNLQVMAQEREQTRHNHNKSKDQVLPKTQRLEKENEHLRKAALKAQEVLDIEKKRSKDNAMTIQELQLQIDVLEKGKMSTGLILRKGYEAVKRIDKLEYDVKGFHQREAEREEQRRADRELIKTLNEQLNRQNIMYEQSQQQSSTVADELAQTRELLAQTIIDKRHQELKSSQEQDRRNEELTGLQSWIQYANEQQRLLRDDTEQCLMLSTMARDVYSASLSTPSLGNNSASRHTWPTTAKASETFEADRVHELKSMEKLETLDWMKSVGGARLPLGNTSQSSNDQSGGTTKYLVTMCSEGRSGNLLFLYDYENSDADVDMETVVCVISEQISKPRSLKHTTYDITLIPPMDGNMLNGMQQIPNGHGDLVAWPIEFNDLARARSDFESLELIICRDDAVEVSVSDHHFWPVRSCETGNIGLVPRSILSLVCDHRVEYTEYAKIVEEYELDNGVSLGIGALVQFSDHSLFPRHPHLDLVCIRTADGAKEVVPGAILETLQRHHPSSQDLCEHLQSYNQQAIATSAWAPQEADEIRLNEGDVVQYAHDDPGGHFCCIRKSAPVEKGFVPKSCLKMFWPSIGSPYLQLTPKILRLQSPKWSPAGITEQDFDDLDNYTSFTFGVSLEAQQDYERRSGKKFKVWSVKDLRGVQQFEIWKQGIPPPGSWYISFGQWKDLPQKLQDTLTPNPRDPHASGGKSRAYSSSGRVLFPPRKATRRPSLPDKNEMLRLKHSFDPLENIDIEIIDAECLHPPNNPFVTNPHFFAGHHFPWPWNNHDQNLETRFSNAKTPSPAVLYPVNASEPLSPQGTNTSNSLFRSDQSYRSLCNQILRQLGASPGDGDSTTDKSPSESIQSLVTTERSALNTVDSERPRPMKPPPTALDAGSFASSEDKSDGTRSAGERKRPKIWTRLSIGQELDYLPNLPHKRSVQDHSSSTLPTSFRGHTRLSDSSASIVSRVSMGATEVDISAGTWLEFINSALAFASSATPECSDPQKPSRKRGIQGLNNRIKVYSLSDKGLPSLLSGVPKWLKETDLQCGEPMARRLSPLEQWNLLMAVTQQNLKSRIEFTLQQPLDTSTTVHLDDMADSDLMSNSENLGHSNGMSIFHTTQGNRRSTPLASQAEVSTAGNKVFSGLRSSSSDGEGTSSSSSVSPLSEPLQRLSASIQSDGNESLTGTSADHELKMDVKSIRPKFEVVFSGSPTGSLTGQVNQFTIEVDKNSSYSGTTMAVSAAGSFRARDDHYADVAPTSKHPSQGTIIEDSQDGSQTQLGDQLKSHSDIHDWQGNKAIFQNLPVMTKEGNDTNNVHDIPSGYSLYDSASSESEDYGGDQNGNKFVSTIKKASNRFYTHLAKVRKAHKGNKSDWRELKVKKNDLVFVDEDYTKPSAGDTRVWVKTKYRGRIGLVPERILEYRGSIILDRILDSQHMVEKQQALTLPIDKYLPQPLGDIKSAPDTVMLDDLSRFCATMVWALLNNSNPSKVVDDGWPWLRDGYSQLEKEKPLISFKHYLLWESVSTYPDSRQRNDWGLPPYQYATAHNHKDAISDRGSRPAKRDDNINKSGENNEPPTDTGGKPLDSTLFYNSEMKNVYESSQSHSPSSYYTPSSSPLTHDFAITDMDTSGPTLQPKTYDPSSPVPGEQIAYRPHQAFSNPYTKLHYIFAIITYLFHSITDFLTPHLEPLKRHILPLLATQLTCMQSYTTFHALHIIHAVIMVYLLAGAYETRRQWMQANTPLEQGRLHDRVRDATAYDGFVEGCALDILRYELMKRVGGQGAGIG